MASSFTRCSHPFHKDKLSLFNVSRVTLLPCIPLNSLDALGVDIAPFSAIPDEAEVLLLPGLPLTCDPADNTETDLWTFNVKTPDVSDTSTESDPPPVRIDYVHPGEFASNNVHMSIIYIFVSDPC